MRLLFIHSDYMRYETKDKAMKAAEEIPDGKKRGSMDEVLVVFATVEEKDSADPTGAAAATAASVREVLAQVRADKVMLYPYAHLSS